MIYSSENCQIGEAIRVCVKKSQENPHDCSLNIQENIIKCVNSSVSKLFDGKIIKQEHSNIHFLVYSSENCQKGEAFWVCVKNSNKNNLKDKMKMNNVSIGTSSSAIWPFCRSSPYIQTKFTDMLHGLMEILGNNLRT